MKSRYLIGFLSALTVSLGATAASASYPVAVWVKVKQVDLEPNAKAPTRVKVHGAAMLYDKSSGTSYPGYSEPALGFLYYECPKGQETTCVSEWADLEKNIKATDDVCVGFGSQSQNPGTLRPWGSKVLYPTDTYPISIGVVTGFTPCKVIEGFLAAPPDGGTAGAGGGGGADGGVAGSAGTAGTAGAGGGTAGTAGSANTGGSAGSTGSGGSTSSGGTSSGSGGSSAGAAGTAGTTGGGDSSGDDGGCSVSGVPSAPMAFFWLTALSALGIGMRRRSRRK